MRLCYVLLSPTWGMHQYTADLANRMVGAGHEVHLVTTRSVPRNRYAPTVAIHTPVNTRDTGFSPYGLLSAPFVVHQALSTLRQVAPDVVHVTGVYLVNPLLLRALRRAGVPVPHTLPKPQGGVPGTRAVPPRQAEAVGLNEDGVPTVHTLHDLHPHLGTAYGRLKYLWNGWVRRRAGHLLVHGQRYQAELVSAGLPPSRVTYTPLTHLFVSHERQRALEQSPPDAGYEPWALFIGRLEEYKGLDVLVEAARRLEGRLAKKRARCSSDRVRVVMAGPGHLERYVHGPLPPNVELRAGLAGDDEAVEWFRRCGLVVLPYVEASQSALVAAAYFFRKPVVVSRVGALPEYVVEGETGWVVPPGDPQALAEVLAAALADPHNLARMGRAGRAWYERQRQAEWAALQDMYARLVGCGQP
jgi:glycosyltransferase involved in cell wall biosynthesis